MVRRLKCGNAQCGKIHHELPDCIVPYKRHSAQTIEAIVNGDEAAGSACEHSTIARIKKWWALMILYVGCVLASLSMKYRIKLTARRKLADVVRALANSHLWPRTRSALAPG